MSTPPPPANPHAALVLFRGGVFCTDCGHVTAPTGGSDVWEWWLMPDGGTPNLDTIAMVLHWMAEEDYPPRDLAYAVEKPWKFTQEFLAAVREALPPDPEPEELLRPEPEPELPAEEEEEPPQDLLKALVLSIDRHRARAGRPPNG